MREEVRQKLLKGNLELDAIRRRWGLPDEDIYKLYRELATEYGLPLEPIEAMREYDDAGGIGPLPEELKEYSEKLTEAVLKKAEAIKRAEDKPIDPFAR
jgi:hypothetical protein